MSNEAKNCWPPLTPHHWLAGYLSTMFQPFTRFSNTSFTIILITILRKSSRLVTYPPRWHERERSYISPGKIKSYFSFYFIFFCLHVRILFLSRSHYKCMSMSCRLSTTIKLLTLLEFIYWQDEDFRINIRKNYY